MTLHKDNKPLITRLIKLIAWGLVSFFILLTIGSGIFYLYRDSIGKKLLLSLNKTQKGEISFSSVTLNPFIHFPNASVHLHDFLYLETTKSDSLINYDTIAALKHVYGAIDIMDLIEGMVNITKITLSDGQINLVQYPDSSINLTNALGIGKFDSTMLVQANVGQNDSAGLNITLDAIALNNINLNFYNLLKGNRLQTDITQLKAAAQIQQQIIRISLYSEFLLHDIAIGNKFNLTQKKFGIDTQIQYDQKQKTILVSDGILTFEELNFKVSGILDVSEKQNVDLQIEGDATHVHLFKLLLSEYGLQNLKSGETYFTGTVRGTYKNKVPLMEFNFGLRNVHISLPHVENEISDLNVEGTFSSGTQPDFSEAQLSINHLKGKLPGGFIDARFSINNFVVPSIDLSWDMKTDVTGFDKIFNTSALDSLHGNISLHHELLSVINPKTGYMHIEKGQSQLLLDSLAFNIPGILQVKNLNGKLQNNKDTLIFSDFKFNANYTDLKINGSIVNLYYLFFQEEKDIWANLTIESDTFDLPAVFSYDPHLGNNFPYKIIDMKMKVGARTTTSKLRQFNSNPEIICDISDMTATIENLFPPANIHKGTMLLSEKDERLLLNFNDFDMEIARAAIFAHVDYHSPNDAPDMINIDVEVKELNPGRLFLWQHDTIPSFADGLLNGIFSTSIETGLDTINFKTFKLNTGEFTYRTQSDTFDIKDLSVDAKNIYYNSHEEKNILETLLGEIQLEIGQINSNYFKEKDIAYNITARNGSVTLTPQKSQLFGKKGQGSFKLSPYKDVPVYEIKYSVNQFLFDDFLSNILSDTMLTGRMNLDIDVTLRENENGNIFSSMNGSIHLNGKDMTLYGVDIDKMIEKYDRSQKFDLLDVGAVVIAGPFGLALTKGSDFANLAMGNIGESTHITNFNSEWEMLNGKINLKDVAFATEENRIAGLGWIDLSTDSLEVTIAVLDTKGCSVLKQTLSGPIDSLQHTEIKIVSTVLGPVTNLVNGALGKECKVVYDGKLAHPPKRKKNPPTD